ncbi:MAG: hypothetical protein ACRDP5_03430 [Streptosporangiaceae bacterium]
MGNHFVNQVNAYTSRYHEIVFREKFQMGVGTGSTLTAINRAVAVASHCDGCAAVALGFQIVTTTLQGLHAIHAVNDSDATDKYCIDKCAAVADSYQVVVATDTPQPLPFGQLLSEAQLNGLTFVGTEFLALQHLNLPLPVIQADCLNLVNQAVTILTDANIGGPNGGWPSNATLTRPTNSPAVTGPDVAPVPDAQPVVQLYQDAQYRPFGG